MRSLLFATCILLGVAAESQALTSIGLYGDPSGGTCTLTAAMGGAPATLYILALVDPGSMPGIQGAEFAVTGLPPGLYTTVPIANPASSAHIGDPFQGGCNIAFSTCQTGPLVLLYTVTVFNVSDADGSRTLRVEQRTQPSDPNFACPSVVNCSPPVFSRFCVAGLSAFLNFPTQVVPPHSPSPVDGAADLPLDVQLSWDWYEPPYCDTHAPQEVLYFGTAPDPPFFTASLSRCPPRPTCLEVGPLEPNTTYYWKAFNSDTGTGPVWHFTTGNLAAERKSWGRVKTFFR